MFKNFFSKKAADAQKTTRIQENNATAIHIPDARPLSPCYIEPLVDVKGTLEENKGYIPVSLLMKAIDDDRMLNIAVAGNYGVGKSSVIKTAERDLKTPHRFIHISLAALLASEHKTVKVAESSEREDGQGEEKTGPDGARQTKEKSVGKSGEKNTISEAVNDKQIEYSILQQILYHDRPQKTPKSRIKRIHKTGGWKPFWVALYIILFVLALLVCLNPKWVSINVLRGSINAAHSFHLIRWALVVLSAIVIRACFYAGKHYDLSITRVSYKDVEMKVKREMSIFNAYLDEIVYFFESTKYDVVVFEDLDRFDNREVIFYKLRELNTILNNSNCLKQKVNFVYAVLDDLFQAVERVKFFDYIVDVIPVVNSLNSYDKLKECIASEELFKKLGQNELINLCDYIQDMRLLLNIVNEFNQFSPLLSSKTMTEKGLLGLIVYKNYIPSDFAQMYNKTGVVATVIENADKYKDRILEKKTSEIQKYQAEIETIGQTKTSKVIQLRKEYLEKGKALAGYPVERLVYKIKGNLYDSDGIAQNMTRFDAFKRGEASLLYNGNVEVSLPSFRAIEQNFGEAGYFDNAIASYQADSDIQIRDREMRIRVLKEEVASLSNSIRSIYSADVLALDNELEALKKEEHRSLVKFLILNGYLDKYYQYYITYFYQNTLTPEDRDFVMLAGRHEITNYEDKLVNVGEVIKRFSETDFATNTSLLNVSLTKEIFSETKYREFRNPLCRSIMSSRELDFILACYRSELKVPESFFYHLHGIYDYWSEISARKGNEQEDLRELYLRFCPLEEGRVNSAMVHWLSENYKFIDRHMARITPKRVVEGLLGKCAPVFSELSLSNTPDEVLKDIMNNQRYDFTRGNVNAMIKRLGFYNKYTSSAYTALCEETRAVALLRRVEANWDMAIKTVFPDGSVRESETAMAAIINNLSASETAVRSYISKQRERVKDARRIIDGRLEFACKNSLVEASWQNIFYYSEEKKRGLPLALLYDNVRLENVGTSLSETEEQKLIDKIVFSDRVKMAKYKALVARFNVPFKEIPRKIQPARMKVLIESDFLEFNEGTFKSIKENYPFSSIFLSRNVSIFLKNPERYSVDNADVVAAMKTLDTKVAKCEFVRAIKENVFAPEEVLAEMVRPLFVSGDLKAAEINLLLLLQIIAKASEADRVKLGRRAILSIPYSKENATMLLRAMGGEYKRLISDTAKSRLSSDRDAVLAVNHLLKNGFIRAVERKEGKIIVTK